MPLMPKKSMRKDQESDMEPGQPKSLAIAYSIKDKNKKRKKMASGGMVSVKDESRPMPSDTHNDSTDVSQSSSKKPLMDADWTDSPTVKQAQKPSITKLSRPKMVGSDSFSVRMRDEAEAGEHKIETEAPESDDKQPSMIMDEQGSDREGPMVPDMQPEHNNKKPPYSKAIEDQYAQDVADADMKRAQNYAMGGMVDDSEDQPDMESEDEQHSSIAAAIMSKRKKMADGGMVDLELESEETSADPNGYDDQNMDAAKKELYDDSQLSKQPMDSNEHGDVLEDEDSHDMVSSLRKKIRAKRGL